MTDNGTAVTAETHKRPSQSPFITVDVCVDFCRIAAPEAMNESMEILLKVFALMCREAVIISPLPQNRSTCVHLRPPSRLSQKGGSHLQLLFTFSPVSNPSYQHHGPIYLNPDSSYLHFLESLLPACPASTPASVPSVPYTALSYLFKDDHYYTAVRENPNSLLMAINLCMIWPYPPVY